MALARRTAAFLLLLVCACTPALPAQAPVRYEITFANAVHHEARVTVTFTEVPSGPLELRMSRTSPGRYALHEFVKNVYDVEITDGNGRALRVERPDLHQWTVTGHGGTVRMTYTLFGDRGDGTYAQIDPTGALLNAPATWVWARQLRDRPVEIRFATPAGSDWDIATQLEPTDDPQRFRAPDLAYLMDSPTLLGDIAWREWTVAGNRGTQTVRFALRHQGTESALDDYVRMVQAVVREEGAVYGEFPTFDYGTYTFLAAYLPWVSGDGMEHRNSTVLTRVARLPEDAIGVLGTVAHEFFHAWNVERIRPVTLEPFDFEAADVSDALWLAEGFTSYYDDLAMRRAGILDDAAFGDRIAGMVDGVVNSPGHRHRSPMEMSRNAPFVDAAVSIDPQNTANIFISYYTWGSALGLALDLTLRSRFDRTLDDFMRVMWERHGKPFRPYTVDDAQAALAQASGDAGFAADFFDRFVRGNELPDFEVLLAEGGFRLAAARPERAVLRLALANDPAGVRIRSRPLEGSAVYTAGLEEGDVITTLDGTAVRSAEDVARVLSGRRPGDAVTVEWRARAGAQRATLRLDADPGLAATPLPGPHPLREAWLRPRATPR
ncbi:MAG: PDZ domain-containing protein [Gemmatimonadota bacterium]